MDAADCNLDRVKGRYIVALLAVTSYVLPQTITLLWTNAQEHAWYWIDIGYYYPLHLLDALFILAVSFLVKPRFAVLLGQFPRLSEWRLLLHVNVLLFSMASALIFAIYLPLSYVAPDFIRWWLEWSYMPIVYLDHDGSLPLLPNALSWLSVVVLAPVAEEILFRGLLLQRWATKWGMTRAIVASSLLFGVLHPDPFGATLFGVGMCLLYLHTRSLWVTIAAHASYNFAVWLWDLHGVLDQGLEYYWYDLQQFRDDWWYGITWAILALATAALFLKRHSSPVSTASLPHSEAESH